MNTSKILVGLTLGSLTIIGCQKKQLSSLADGNLGGKLVTNAFHANIYVDAAATSPFDGSTGHPFKTINDAVAVTVAGDVVNIRPGNYLWSNSGDAIVSINKSGTASSPITYQAADMANMPKIISKVTDNTNGTYKALVVDADHIILKGLELVGDKDNAVTTTDNVIAKYNTNGIQLSGIYDLVGGNKVYRQRFDIQVLNCKVHDFPGVGIGTKDAGQITIDGNECYNNAWYSQYGNSGISILIPNNLGVANDGSVDGDARHPKNFITNNLCYNNKTTVNTINQTIKTDGSGIIVDVNRALVVNGNPGNPNGDFRGYTKVENNVSYNNGGAGICITRAQNVSISNNTTCSNGYIVGYAEINFDRYSKNCSATNNICYARPTANGGKCYNNLSTDTGAIIFDYNLYYPYGTPTVVTNTFNVNGTASTTATTKSMTANPIFAGAPPTAFGQTVPVANFKIQNTSPAKDAGINYGAFYSYFDRDGFYRGGTPDLGAYEFH